MEYVCLGCGRRFPADQLLYSCPECAGVLLLEDEKFSELKSKSGEEWREIFDKRQMTRNPALRGVFRFYELLAPVLDERDILYLGEGSTPIVEASPRLREIAGVDFAFKNEGQNPSASFKDRGMACAFSFLKWLARKKDLSEILAICASTGDTSAAAALYGAWAGDPIRTVVILPKGKVTPQQLAQPLGSGATVLELPGVFDDCMKVVELLAEKFNVALLNSKNSWRILGQESYACEIAQWFGWDTRGICLFVPIGNAGNITAIMSGMLKMLELGVIETLPRVFGVQSEHANPVYRYYNEKESDRVWRPVQVQPSVAQAAMIGDPVSFPRVRKLVERYTKLAGKDAFHVVSVSEQQIMDATLLANRNGHIACTQGGECFAGLMIAKSSGLIGEGEKAVLDSTAHILKFVNFQTMYFEDKLPPAYEISPREEFKNHPRALLQDIKREDMDPREFASLGARAVAATLNLKEK
ncbi:MAG: pyridoxal-phosphate dependent enzyme [Desulfovibrio sp.]|nr:pyridoxal-phosphate dependent enzyme [Desulfovibrio sp.]